MGTCILIQINSENLYMAPHFLSSLNYPPTTPDTKTSMRLCSSE